MPHEDPPSLLVRRSYEAVVSLVGQLSGAPTAETIREHLVANVDDRWEEDDPAWFLTRRLLPYASRRMGFFDDEQSAPDEAALTYRLIVQLYDRLRVGGGHA